MEYSSLKNLLIAKSANERLQVEIENIINASQKQINIYTISKDSEIEHEGQLVESSLEPLDIHLAWFNRDLIEQDTSRIFATSVLKSPSLEWVQSLAAGFDNPFFKMLGKKGIRLSNSDAQAPAIAEYVIASVMHRFHGFEERREYQLNKQWTPNDFKEISNSNWLIVGFGNIGSRVGVGVEALGANVTGVKRQAVDKFAGSKKIICYEDIPQCLEDQDVVVLSCALTDETRDMVNENFLSQMKEGAILVNIGRGDLVDEDALLASLDRSHLDFAILDVFRTEPLPEESPMWEHNRVLVTPHSSNRGSGTNVRGDELFLHNLRAYLNDQPLKNEVDNSELT
ncbi:MAG: phosphoglycerate dehydrogenase-like enzyme [Candidatus Azotimanducaceae bacterium]